MKKYLGFLAALSVAGSAVAAPVTDWVILFDGQTANSGFAGASEATNSPTMGGADADSIAANFASVTLADGDFVRLTGSVSLDNALVDNQFRFGLFDGDNPVTAGDGTGYVGYYATSAVVLADGEMKSGDGSPAVHPFSGGAATIIQADPTGTAGAVLAGTVLDFEMTITRSGGLVDITASLIDPLSTYNIQYSVTGTAAVPGSFTYDSVSFLIGGGQNGTASSFSNIDVTTGIVPEPGSLALLGLGGLALLRRRRA